MQFETHLLICYIYTYIYLCYLKDKDNEYIITYVSINFQNCGEEYNKKIKVDNNSKSEVLHLY